MIDIKDLSQELLAAIRDVGNRHRINPNNAIECIVLVQALSSVLLALVHAADPDARAVCVSQEGDGLGIVTTVHTKGGIFDVEMPEELQS